MLLGTKPLDSVTSYRANQRSIEMLPRLKLPIPHYSRTKYQWYEIDKKEEKHFVAGLDGWLLIADPCKTSASGPQCLQLQLFNPITSATIALPDRPPTLAKLLSSRDDIIQAVLSSSPDNVHVDCNVIVLLELSPYLAWCKVLGEGRGWKFLSNEIFGTRPEEVSYYGETFYARDSKNVYVIRDLIVTSSHRNFSVRAVSLSSLQVTKYPINRTHNRLAPDLAGQLLIIYDSGKSVYKLVVSSSSSDYKWEKVKSLDGYAVFFGTHQSFCLPASDDSNNRVIANRIYYPRKVVNRDFGCSASFVDPYNGLIKRSSFWFLPMNRYVNK